MKIPEYTWYGLQLLLNMSIWFHKRFSLYDSRFVIRNYIIDLIQTVESNFSKTIHIGFIPTVKNNRDHVIFSTLKPVSITRYSDKSVRIDLNNENVENIIEYFSHIKDCKDLQIDGIRVDLTENILTIRNIAQNYVIRICLDFEKDRLPSFIYEYIFRKNRSVVKHHDHLLFEYIAEENQSAHEKLKQARYRKRLQDAIYKLV